MGCDDYVANATAFNFQCTNGHSKRVLREKVFADREQPEPPSHNECSEPMALVDTAKAW